MTSSTLNSSKKTFETSKNYISWLGKFSLSTMVHSYWPHEIMIFLLNSPPKQKNKLNQLAKVWLVRNKKFKMFIKVIMDRSLGVYF